MTVPCCGRCNGEFQKHDEYFRIAMMTGIDREKFPNETADSVRAIRSLARPQSINFARKFLEGYDPSAGSLTFDSQRIQIVLRRIAKGLFFHHKNARMPADIDFECREVPDDSELPQEGRKRIERLTSNQISIGKGAFRYAFEPVGAPESFGEYWLMRFYDHKTFFCVAIWR